jgi:hypothetical protein
MLSRIIWQVGSVALLTALTAFPAPVAAQTSDGVTPAEETACNGQTGAAYGLCTSFCEAMDCDSTAPAASPTACNKVYDKFLQLTGAAPPCSCPCSAGWNDVQQFAAAASLPVTYCATGQEESQVHFGSDAVRLNLVSYTVTGSYCTGWTGGGSPIVSKSPLTAPQIAACRSVISNICTQAQLP